MRLHIIFRPLVLGCILAVGAFAESIDNGVAEPGVAPRRVAASDGQAASTSLAVAGGGGSDCSAAASISGVGVFQFDNTAATTDGPPDAACDFFGESQIEKDVWFCWTSPCSDKVFVRTCYQTTVDTKLAVYDGCACPSTDGNLLDCADDSCSLQSAVVFPAMAGRAYLIRLGNYPGELGGTGSFEITCSGPPNAACPGAGACCNPHLTPGCADEFCCRSVCACDDYCCNVEWDENCATFGFQNNGCGAEVLCLCGQPCGNPLAGDCCSAHENSGCNNLVCCEAVCGFDAFCCDIEWDAQCAELAAAGFCQTLCDSSVGACCYPLIGVCGDDVHHENCTGEEQSWSEGVRCAEIDPPCETPGACCDLLRGECVDHVRGSACAGTQQSWTEGVRCAEVICEAAVGACCDHDPFGGCADGITRAECDCASCEWMKFVKCADIECSLSSIPTLNVWGLTILSLMLLIVAKIRFGRAYASNV